MCSQNGPSREGTAASDAEAQNTFLLESTEKLTGEPTITLAEAKILSSALNHDYYNEMTGDDKFFTLEEYRKKNTSVSQVCTGYFLRSKQAVDNNECISLDDARTFVQDFSSFPKVCNCPAHEEFRQTDDDLYSDCLGRLISLPPMLTDHYGSELAELLLPFLFKKAEMKHSIRKCGLGSPYSVNFVLQMPSGRVYQFTGRPDFTINSPHLGTAVSRFTLQGIGEIQSPPWRRRESKTAALSQAGVYTVGQFVKEGALESLPAVVLHKDKTAQVAVAKLDRSQTMRSPDSLGVVSFKLVGQVDPIDLRDPNGLRTFSGLLRGVMGSTTPTPT